MQAQPVVDVGSLGAIMIFEAIIVTAGIFLVLRLLFYAKRGNPSLFDSILHPIQTLRRSVPPKSVLMRADGSMLPEKQHYVPADDDLLVPLDRRMISPHAPPNSPEARFFTAFYEPDASNIHTFVRTLREANGPGEIDFTKFDSFLSSKCASLLLMTPRPDLKSLADAYGVKFSNLMYPPEEAAEPEPRDERPPWERRVSATIQQLTSVAALAKMYQQFEKNEHPLQKEFPVLTDPESKRHVLDIIRNALERAKSGQ